MNPSEWMDEAEKSVPGWEPDAVAVWEDEVAEFVEADTKSVGVKEDACIVESKWTYRLEIKEGFSDFHWMKIYRDDYQVASQMFSWKWTARRWARKRMKQLQRGPRVVEGEL